MSVKASWTGKITSSHSTLTETSAKVANILHAMHEVTKISLAKIDQVGGGRKDLKFFPITGGIRVKVRGSGAVHELYVYTKHPAAVQAKLTEQFFSR